MERDNTLYYQGCQGSFSINTNMKKCETEALIDYLTFSLESFCDEMIQHTTPTGEQIIYDKAYSLLQDIEITLDTQRKMTQKQEVKRG